jgi:hypothetical protein
MENAGVAHPVGRGETRVEDARVLDRGLLDDLALHRELVQLLGRGTPDREGEGFPRFAAQHVDGFGHADLLGQPIVDFQNLVSGKNPGAGRRSVLAGGDDGERVILRRDRHADALVGTVGVTLELVEDLRLHELRMRIERGEHALEGAVDQLLVGDLVGVDVTLADRLKHFGEQLHFLETRILARLFLGADPGCRANGKEQARENEGGKAEVSFHPVTFRQPGRFSTRLFLTRKGLVAH